MRHFLILSIILISLTTHSQTVDFGQYMYPSKKLQKEKLIYTYRLASDTDTLTLVSEQYVQTEGVDDPMFHEEIRKVPDSAGGDWYKTLISIAITKEGYRFREMEFHSYFDGKDRCDRYFFDQTEVYNWEMKVGDTLCFSYGVRDCRFMTPGEVALAWCWEVYTYWEGEWEEVTQNDKTYNCLVLYRRSLGWEHKKEGGPVMRSLSKIYFAKGIGMIRLEEEFVSVRAEGDDRVSNSLMTLEGWEVGKK